jgi:peptide methionine sulfoxide reductase MsrB
MSIMKFFRSIWDDIKAFRRGESRGGASRMATGRVYSKKTSVDSGSGYASFADPTAEVELRITRADGSVEIQKHKARVSLNG